MRDLAVTHFRTAAGFRRWLEKNHATATELQVGFHRKDSGMGGMSYKEAVDEALCFGWIDGLVRKIDAGSFTHRFTPRKPRSIWSNVNVANIARLTAAGRMQPAGRAAYALRDPQKTGTASFEKRPGKLPPALETRFKAEKKAWAFFTAQAPWYRRLIIHKIVSARQEATRGRWLARAIAASAAGVRL
jgi:uncharacterized protein YdeI (YjbR/CyaY-like superfamily)